MIYEDFMIDYCLFLINEFNIDRSEATKNAQSWWDKFQEDNSVITGFRKDKSGKPSIQVTNKITI